MAWEDLTPILTKSGRELPIGKVLIFDYEGSPTYLKIVRKFKGKVWAKRLDPAKFLKPDEADAQVTIVKN